MYHDIRRCLRTSLNCFRFPFFSCNFQLSTEHICVQRRSSPHPAWLSWLASSWTSPLAAAKVHLLRNFGLRHATPKCHNPLRSHPNPACVQCGHLAFIQNHSMTKLIFRYYLKEDLFWEMSNTTSWHMIKSTEPLKFCLQKPFGAFRTNCFGTLKQHTTSHNSLISGSCPDSQILRQIQL